MGMVTAGLLVVCQDSRPYQEDCERVFVQTILRAVTHLQRKAGPLVSSNREILSQPVDLPQRILAGPVVEPTAVPAMESAA